MLLETKLAAYDLQRVEEFEAFMENLEFWFVAHLKDLNKVKKLLLHRLEAKLEKIAANTIYEALCKMSEDERKHFTLKNKAYIDAVKVDSGVSER